MRNITQGRIDLIKRFEGFGSTIYTCPAGYGHLVWSEESFNEVSETKAEELLLRNVEPAESAVLGLVNASLADSQFDALVSFTYNRGGGALQQSTLRRKINREEYGELPEQFMHLVWVVGPKLIE